MQRHPEEGQLRFGVCNCQWANAQRLRQIGTVECEMMSVVGARKLDDVLLTVKEVMCGKQNEDYD